jgi:ATP-binding cassette subfamily B (MDR/TAP) protein 1
MANANSKVRAASADFSQSSSMTLDVPSTAKVVTVVESQQTLPEPMTRVSQAFSHVKYLLFFAVTLGIVVGVAFVIAAWLHGRAVSALNISDISVMRRTVDRWALWFLILALGTFVVMACHVFGLETSGENIVSEFRRESARALIRQDIPFFERESGGSGSLTAAAASHPQNVGNVIGVVLSQFVTSVTNLIATLIMAFVLSWRLAVMAIPSLFATCTLGYLNLRWLQIFEAEIVAEDEKQANYVADSVNSAQLNAALTRESEVLRQYNIKFSNRVLNRRWLLAANFALAGTQAMVNFFGGLLFWWGAKQRAERKVVSGFEHPKRV